MFSYEQNDVPAGLVSLTVKEILSWQKISQHVCGKLIDRISLTPTKAQRWWENELQVREDEIDWNALYTDIYTISNHFKLREFHFKWLHNIIALNNKLFKWNMVETTLCDFCNSSLDSIYHRFWMCPCVQAIWVQLREYVNEILEIQWQVDYNVIALNRWENNVHMMKCIVLCTKYYIYRCFITKTLPSFQSLIEYLNEMEHLEYRSAFRHDKMIIHERKWKDWARVPTNIEEATNT